MGKLFLGFLLFLLLYPVGATASYETSESPVKHEVKSDFKIVVIKTGAYRPYVEDEPLNSELDEFIATVYGIVFTGKNEIPGRVGENFGIIFFCESKISSLVRAEITNRYDPPLEDPKTGKFRREERMNFITRSGEFRFFNFTVLKVSADTTYLVKTEIRCWDQSVVRVFTIVPVEPKAKK
ncbi:MAG: hypothetical protein MUC28_03745 [Planctomycetes bacterium]|jgi:hypothetical protein|nr:hypothetical protein [Planctomycetota bacterium]